MPNARRDAWNALETAVRRQPLVPLDPASLQGAVGRYFRHALGADPRAANAAILEMRGHIRLQRWLPFRARQLLAPRHGTVWQARVAGVISGSDRYVSGEGGMDWRLVGIIPVMRAASDDVTRSAAERAAAESIWVPAAVAPGPTSWTEIDDTHLDVTFTIDGHDVTIHHVIDDDGRLRSSSMMRWGDPDQTGTWQQLPFGVDVTTETCFDGVTIPSAGRAGWHFRTERWPEGEFFRFRITSCRTVP